MVRLEPEDQPPLTAIGPLLGIRKGDELRLSGRWVDHPRYGRQFEAESYVQVAPSTIEGLRRYLGSGKIRGLGPKRAELVVEAFGLDTLDVLENEPERLLEIRGIGPTTLDKIRESWEHHRGIQQIMVFLTGHGVSPAIAVRVFQRYGPAAVDVVRSNPYRLAEDIFGVGFLTADRIARQLGIPAEAPERLEAGVLHTLAGSRRPGPRVPARGSNSFAPRQNCSRRARSRSRSRLRVWLRGNRSSFAPGQMARRRSTSRASKPPRGWWRATWRTF